MPLTARVLIRAVTRVGVTCGEDEVFRQATKFWTGALRLGIDTHSVSFIFDSGDLISVVETHEEVEEVDNQFGFDASSAVWEKVFIGTKNVIDSEVLGFSEGLTRTGDRNAYWRYYPAVRRLFELMSQQIHS